MKVTLEELKEYVQSHEVLFASAVNSKTGQNKAMYCLLNGGYRVTNKMVTVYEGSDPQEALSVFNGL